MKAEKKYSKDALQKWDSVYQRFRGQIEHEDTLYNQRILWLIYIQAFLFATLGLLMRARYGENSGSLIPVVYSIIALIAILGCVIAKISRRVLDNAGQALDEVRDMWSDLVKNEMPKNIRKYFPHVSGGKGTIRTVKRSHNQLDKDGYKTIFRSRNLPDMFFYIWLAVIFILFIDIHTNYFPL